MSPLENSPADPQPQLEPVTGAMGLRKFVVPRRWYKAAQALADGVLTSEQIAQKLEVTTTTLRSWKRKPEFQRIVAAYAKHVHDDQMKVGIAQKHNRLTRLDRAARKIERVIEARAADAVENPLFEGVPGADSGLIVRDIKGVGAGEAAQVVDVFRFDDSLHKQYLATLEQAAKEAGGKFEEAQPGTNPGGSGVHVTFNFPTLSKADMDAVESAQVIDLPPAARRLLARPSDGAQR